MYRKTLSADGLYTVVNKEFNGIKDHRRVASVTSSLKDNLMSAIAMFAFKAPSLLCFDKEWRDDEKGGNLRNLFGIDDIPDDTSMRRTIDPIETKTLSGVFKPVFKELQRGKALEGFQFYQGKLLLALDGTGLFSSHQVHCDQCCVKNHRDGTKTFYHQMLAGTLVHPDKSVVLPMCSEPISNTDGHTKNDCERNAAKRLLKSVRDQFPKMDIIVTEDGLSANVPHIRELKNNSFSYILGIKPGDHKLFFERIKEPDIGFKELETTDAKGTIRSYRYVNDIALRCEEPDVRINFVEIREYPKKGRKKTFTFVTDLKLSSSNVEKICKGGRARWKIENETFNTLKNQGYQFEHNFGHGKENLCNNFAVLMFLAFLIDQIQELCCSLYKAARSKCGPKYALWEKMRVFLEILEVPDWKTFW